VEQFMKFLSWNLRDAWSIQHRSSQILVLCLVIEEQGNWRFQSDRRTPARRWKVEPMES